MHVKRFILNKLYSQILYKFTNSYIFNRSSLQGETTKQSTGTTFPDCFTVFAITNRALNNFPKKSLVSQCLTALLYAIFISCLNCGCSDAKDDLQEDGTVKFEKSAEPAINPGQGWILYNAPYNQSEETMALAATGYTRFYWDDINPAEGVYNWASIDGFISQWAAKGKQASFGIMPVDTYSRPRIFPSWLVDKGMKYTIGRTEQSATLTHHIPVWNDPVYVEAQNKLAAALAERYDGNPNIAFIDVRVYGNWGERHLIPFKEQSTPITDEEEWQLLIKPYFDSFDQTQLLVDWAMTSKTREIDDWIVGSGGGLRCNGIMGGYNTGVECAKALNGGQPAVWEFVTSYRNMEIGAQFPWSDESFLKDIRDNTPTYVCLGMWGDDAQYFLSKKPDLIRKVTGMLGYHLSMTTGKYTAKPGAGEAADITLAIENTGLGTMLTPCVIKLVLLDKNGEAASSFTTDWDAHSVMPGTTTELTASVAFKAISAGDYKIAIGLFRNETDAKPTYKLENTGMSRASYYVIGDFTIAGSVGVNSESVK